MVQVTPPLPSARAGSLQQSERTRGGLHFVFRKNGLLYPQNLFLLLLFLTHTLNLRKPWYYQQGAPAQPASKGSVCEPGPPVSRPSLAASLQCPRAPG